MPKEFDNNGPSVEDYWGEDSKTWTKEKGMEVFMAKRALSRKYSATPDGIPGGTVVTGNVFHTPEQFHHCPDCGAHVSETQQKKHDEWHETLVESIREHITEQMDDKERERLELMKELAAAQYELSQLKGMIIPPEFPNMPTIRESAKARYHRHSWVDKALLGEPRLLVCEVCGQEKGKYN